MYTHRALPQIQGQLRLAGLSEPVVVIRDQWGVPHLYAKSLPDLMFASGFVQAQDRLFQMDLMRRVCEGRLAEWVGPDGLASDRFARVIGFHRQAKRNLAHLPPDSKKLLDAYAAGVNAMIESRKDDLPLEYTALRRRAEAWKPEDTLAIALYVGWGLTMNWRIELLRLGLAEERDADTMWKIMPRSDGQGPNIIPPSAWPGHTVGAAGGAELPVPRFATRAPSALDAEGQGLAALLEADRRFRRLINGSAGMALASNSWVVDGTLSASGKPILCNDPHLELTLPSVWYELHLVGGGLDVIGVTFPGVPTVILGHTRETAWAATTTCTDMDDLYLETVDPSDPNRYKVRDEWVNFELVKETIKIRGESPGAPQVETVTARISRHGPIINDVLSPPVKLSATVALRWTGFELTDPIAAFLGIAQATDWAGFRRSIQRLGCPVQNWVYADAAGNIAYIAAGLYPVRARSDGSFPVSGSSGEFEWQGFVPLDNLPQVLNPSTHYLVTANNQVMPADRLPYVITGNYGPPYRAARITELLTREPEKKWTAETMARIQMDTLSIRAKRLLPVFLKVLDQARASNNDLERAWRQLQTWDGNMTAEASAPTIFDVTYFQALCLTYQDEMSPELLKWLQGEEAIEYAFDNLLEKGDSPLFDDRKTAAVETRDDIILRAFQEAIKELTREESPRMSTWQWGQFHQLRLVHPLGQVPEFRRFADFFKINFAPVPMPGGRNTVNNGFYFFGEGYNVRVGPSMRHIVDFGQVEKARLSYPGGQSGQPFSPHYGDLLKPWLAGQGHPMLMTRSEIEAQKRAQLTLMPGGGGS